MTSLRGSSTHQPLSSSSTPSSPIVEEEDLAKASAWDDEDTSTLVPSKWKGKGRQRDDDDDDDRTVDGDEVQRETGEYPPMAEEDLESRKIEQNLKRWETLEKQRRKKARESRASTKSEPPSSAGSSTFSVSGVGRRASELWSGRAKRTDRAHPHQMLENVDESLPMDETGPPSASSPADTPRNSTADAPRTVTADISALPPSPPSDNPFDSPAYTEREPEPNALMTAANPGSLPPTPKANGDSTPQRPILQVTGPSYVKQPPPQPLDLPAPATPPPQPGKTLPPSQQRQQAEMEEEDGRRKQWWTEWLCGCREEGDDQAGRTNPME